MTKKRNDSDSNSAVDGDVARLASIIDFSYEAQLCLLLHFALIWPLTPHPWHMTWLFQWSPFLSLAFLSLPFPSFECRPRHFFVLNNADSGVRQRVLRRRASKDRRWVAMLATVSAFSVSSSVDAKVRHSLVFGRLDTMENFLQQSSIVMSHTARSLIILSWAEIHSVTEGYDRSSYDVCFAISSRPSCLLMLSKSALIVSQSFFGSVGCRYCIWIVDFISGVSCLHALSLFI